MAADRGSLDDPSRRAEPATAPPPSVAPLAPLPWRVRCLIWLGLQVAGGVALIGAWLLLTAIAPLFGGGESFLERWSTVFVVVPATFIPALVGWHRIALARFGKRGTLFRVVAEVAFAIEVIGCVLFQNLA
ncbi:MAG: hypothetical protein EXS13_08615 [Planctomycetes bacterium]|nr:hypothetical protein [Planctomycetota bacterium]